MLEPKRNIASDCSINPAQDLAHNKLAQPDTALNVQPAGGIFHDLRTEEILSSAQEDKRGKTHDLLALTQETTPVWFEFKTVEAEELARAVNELFFRDFETSKINCVINEDIIERLALALHGRAEWPISDFSSMAEGFEGCLEFKFSNTSRIENGRINNYRELQILRESQGVEYPVISVVADDEGLGKLRVRIIWDGIIHPSSSKNIEYSWGVIQSFSDQFGMCFERELFVSSPSQNSVYTASTAKARLLTRNLTAELSFQDKHPVLHPHLLGICAARNSYQDNGEREPITARCLNAHNALVQILMKNVEIPLSPQEITGDELTKVGPQKMLLEGKQEYQFYLYDGYILIAGPESTGLSMLEDIQELHAYEIRMLELDECQNNFSVKRIFNPCTSRCSSEKLLNILGFNDSRRIADVIHDSLEKEIFLNPDKLQELLFRSVSRGQPLILRSNIVFSFDCESHEEDGGRKLVVRSHGSFEFGRSTDGVVMDEVQFDLYSSLPGSPDGVLCSDGNVGFSARTTFNSSTKLTSAEIDPKLSEKIFDAIGLGSPEFRDVSLARIPGCLELALPNQAIVVFDLPKKDEI